MTRVLVAVSGGIDSVVLLDRVIRNGMEVGVAHVHHGLRPESDEEYEFVRRLADKYDVPFHGKRLAFPNGGSQASYRTARYAFFEQVMQKFDYTQLMTAHHADDQLETVLIQLQRNVVEVTGIPERRPFAGGELVRPLLSEPKRELIAYAKRYGLEWREDASNATTEYLRNQVRHQIVPQLLASQPDLVQVVSETARHQRELWRTRYRQMENWIQDNVRLEMKAFHVKSDNLMCLNPVERYTVGRLLSMRYGVEVGTAIDRLLTRAQGSGHFDLEGSWGLRKQDGLLSLQATGQSLLAPHKQVVTTFPAHVVFGTSLFSLDVEDDTDGIPLEAIELPLIIRSVEAGDAMKLSIGTKKVARIFIDAKIPREKRPFVPLVVDATGRIIAIVGVRVSDFPDKSGAMCPRLMVK
ncbi:MULTISPECIES: tRNA lysidine(34) synthetase TilS [Exiguobacterium]|jgi:tRNA(Ile)-lysidine synthetase-like protein|uniref:tRNA lysidine(34) synthetase TilS n=1 Tax=Exiguobacterium TaxID=33986 RepID=UPI0004982AC3|nr:MULTISPECIES: tRNA lysidine(34) synthetase TilS [Exiguobacterium]